MPQRAIDQPHLEIIVRYQEDGKKDFCSLKERVLSTVTLFSLLLEQMVDDACGFQAGPIRWAHDSIAYHPLTVDQVTCRLNPNPKEPAYFAGLIQENRDMQRFLSHKFLDGLFAFAGDDEK